MKRKTVLVTSALALLSLAGTAAAGVPGWARIWHGTNLDVPSCKTSAISAVRSLTGVSPTVSTIDSATVEIRGFTANEGIFAYCTGGATDICPNRPVANLTILTFSSAGPTAANNAATWVNAAFGNPILIDCNR